MRHARDDYQRIQDPAEEPEIYRLIGDLGRACEAGDQGRIMEILDVADWQEMIRFGQRAEIPEGCNPIGTDEPVFLVRAQDLCAPGTVACYAALADVAGSPDVAELAQIQAQEMRRWQADGHSPKAPGLRPA